MPYLTEYIDDGRGILHTGRGVLTGQEIINTAKNHATNIPHPERITHALIDLTKVTNLQVSTDEMKIITAIDKKNSEFLKQVSTAIAAPEDIAYGMSRMYAGMLPIPGWTIRVFRTMKEARTWLYSQLPVKD